MMNIKSFFKRASWPALLAVVAVPVALKFNATPSLSSSSIPLKDFKIISRTLELIETTYVDRESVNPSKMLKNASKELERIIPPLIVHEEKDALKLEMGDKKLTLDFSDPLSLVDVSSLLGKMLGFLDLFYQGKVEADDRLSATLNGVVDTLDPHSNYLPAKVYNEFKIGTKGHFGGLGIVIGMRDGDLAVIAPIEDTPASNAGIKAKDKIVQIGEESTINMNLTEAVEKLRGPVGTKVSLTISRTGTQAPLKFTLTRAMIHIQAVAGRPLENPRFALIKIKNFQEDTLPTFEKLLKSFQKEAPLEGLILDLRNNPGGLLDQAIAISDYFLAAGTIVKTVGANDLPLEVEQAVPGDGGEQLPLVILINEGSASASEIVAGTLQLNNRAIILGNRSFGKGSVQTVYDLKDGSALKLTIAQYLTAQDQRVQSIGINPDVGLIPMTVGEKQVDLVEDVKNRELDLRNHHNNKEAPDIPDTSSYTPPPFQMSYLSEEPKDKEEESSKISLKEDFPILFAEKILELQKGAPLRREEVARKIPTLLESLKKTEATKLEKAMSKIDIDWSAGDNQGKPQAVITTTLLDEAGKTKPTSGFLIGESGFLEVTVENKGSAPFYQLEAVTQSEDPLFANLEFPFGKIAPKEKKTWKTALKVPDMSFPRDIPVTLHFIEKQGRAPKDTLLSIRTEEPATPLFEYSYRLIDNGTEGTSGNGNSQIDKQETIGLDIRVKNIGKGLSTKPAIALKKIDGNEVYIEKGREELKALAPGEEAHARLKFRVPTKIDGEKISFDLTLYDTRLGEEMTDRLTFPLTKNPVATPAANTAQRAPIIELPAPTLTAQGASYIIKGRATDDRELHHLIVFVGTDKVFYQAPASQVASLDFEVKLSLKKGINVINVIAQDDRDLTSRREWIVWRK